MEILIGIVIGAVGYPVGMYLNERRLEMWPVAKKEATSSPEEFAAALIGALKQQAEGDWDEHEPTFYWLAGAEVGFIEGAAALSYVFKKVIELDTKAESGISPEQDRTELFKSSIETLIRDVTKASQKRRPTFHFWATTGTSSKYPRVPEAVRLED